MSAYSNMMEARLKKAEAKIKSLEALNLRLEGTAEGVEEAMRHLHGLVQEAVAVATSKQLDEYELERAQLLRLRLLDQQRGVEIREAQEARAIEIHERNMETSKVHAGQLGATADYLRSLVPGAAKGAE